MAKWILRTAICLAASCLFGSPLGLAGSDSPTSLKAQRVESLAKYEAGAIETDAAGRVFLLLPGDHSIVRLTPDLEFDIRIGAIGGGIGELYRPQAFNVRADGRIACLDAGNERVVVRDEAGVPTEIFPAPHDSRSIIQLPDDRILVSVWPLGVGRGEIWFYSSTGKLLNIVDAFPSAESKGFQGVGKLAAGLDGRFHYGFLGLPIPEFDTFGAKGDFLGRTSLDDPGMDTCSNLALQVANSFKVDGDRGFARTLAGVRVVESGLWIVACGERLYRYQWETKSTHHFVIKSDDTPLQITDFIVREGDILVLSRGEIWRVLGNTFGLVEDQPSSSVLMRQSSP